MRNRGKTIAIHVPPQLAMGISTLAGHVTSAECRKDARFTLQDILSVEKRIAKRGESRDAMEKQPNVK